MRCSSQCISIPVWYDYKIALSLEKAYTNFISIPVWYDYKCSDLNAGMHYYSISIPVWYDYKSLVWFAPWPGCLISIPVWYDYKQIQVSVWDLDRWFQFQYGTIISCRISHYSWRYFISIPVWYDYKTDLLTKPSMPLPISIPVWYDYKPFDDFKKIFGYQSLGTAKYKDFFLKSRQTVKV